VHRLRDYEAAQPARAAQRHRFAHLGAALDVAQDERAVESDAERRLGVERDARSIRRRRQRDAQGARQRNSCDERHPLDRLEAARAVLARDLPHGAQEGLEAQEAIGARQLREDARARRADRHRALEFHARHAAQPTCSATFR
jgi:hypothetical protein